MSGELSSEIRVTEAPAGAAAFVPTGRRVTFELEKLPEAAPDASPIVRAPLPPALEGMRPFFPPEFAPVGIPEIRPEKKICFLDIETTGVTPWNSRIICISALDPSAEVPEPVTFFDPDERLMVTEFLEWWMENNFVELIGYNLIFDTRFIFVKMMRYLLQYPAFLNVATSDVMQIMAQIHEKFTYGRNKSGSLEDWMKFFWGEPKNISASDILTLYREGDILPIITRNRMDVEATYKLWSLSRYALGEYTPVVVPPAPEMGVPESDDVPVRIQCDECLSENFVRPGEKVTTCTVCGKKLLI